MRVGESVVGWVNRWLDGWVGECLGGGGMGIGVGM